MHRAILLALLSVPVLIIMQIALFRQPIPWREEALLMTSRDQALARGGPPTPTRFVIAETTAQGY